MRSRIMTNERDPISACAVLEGGDLLAKLKEEVGTIGHTVC